MLTWVCRKDSTPRSLLFRRYVTLASLSPPAPQRWHTSVGTLTVCRCRLLALPVIWALLAIGPNGYTLRLGGMHHTVQGANHFRHAHVTGPRLFNVSHSGERAVMCSCLVSAWPDHCGGKRVPPNSEG